MRRLVYLNNPLIAINRFAFSIDSPQVDATKPTKHNPNAIKDLRGYERLQELTEAQKASSPIHSTYYQPFTAYALSEKLLSNKIILFLSKCFKDTKSVIASDSLYLPRIHQNGVPLYDSLEAAQPYIVANKLFTKVMPFSIAFLVPYPATSILLYGIAFAVYSKLNWKLASDLVIKAELLPQTEQIVYQKISLLGNLKTSRVSITDLEAVTFYELFGEDNMSEKSGRGLLNKEVAFRLKGSGELLFFDANGIWNQEGLNHTLVK